MQDRLCITAARGLVQTAVVEIVSCDARLITDRRLTGAACHSDVVLAIAPCVPTVRRIHDIEALLRLEHHQHRWRIALAYQEIMLVNPE